MVLVLFTSVPASASSSSSVYTNDETDEARLIRACEDYYSEGSERIWCILSEFYAFRKVLDIILIHKDNEGSELYEVMSNLLNQWYLPEYGTFDFMQIHLDYEDYKENCQ